MRGGEKEGVVHDEGGGCEGSSPLRKAPDFRSRVSLPDESWLLNR